MHNLSSGNELAALTSVCIVPEKKGEYCTPAGMASTVCAWKSWPPDHTLEFITTSNPQAQTSKCAAFSQSVKLFFKFKSIYLWIL